MAMIEESDFLSCCGSSKFAREMVAASPFSSLDHALQTANEIWFNKIDIHGWLEAFDAHPRIGDTSSKVKKTEASAEWSKGEQSTAMVSATASTLQELSEWNARYRDKFGFVFLICASGRSASEILAELKKRFGNKPIVELENAAGEQMKITDLRLAKLFAAKEASHMIPNKSVDSFSKDRIGVIGAHMTAASDVSPTNKSHVVRTRPPITTHVLDVARGLPGAGIEVHLEMWRGAQERPSFQDMGRGEWLLHGSSVTDSDGRSGALMGIVDDVAPGFYRISFNTGKYSPAGFFPYVCVVFEIKEPQKSQHFHVPLLLSPFSFTTYRGS